MADIDEGGHAFPIHVPSNGMQAETYHGGMTLRDWFAGQALAGICGDGIPGRHHEFHETARDAYDYADAMLKARGWARPAALALALVLLLPSLASATPITLGDWIAAPAASEAGDAPWNHVSMDGPHQNAGYRESLGPGWEYLDAPWAFSYEPDVVWVEIDRWTIFANREISQTPAGAFQYRNLETGDHYLSDAGGWMQWVLARRVGVDRIDYLALLEDMQIGKVYPFGLSDRDYQDSVWSATVRIPPHEEGGRPVAEPSLFGLAAVGLAAVYRRVIRGESR